MSFCFEYQVSCYKPWSLVITSSNLIYSNDSNWSDHVFVQYFQDYLSTVAIVDRSGSYFGTWEDADFPKVLKKMARPGECAEKSVDLHKIVKKNSVRCRNKCHH